MNLSCPENHIWPCASGNVKSGDRTTINLTSTEYGSYCPLYYATRELHDWLTMDLAQWKAVQHPQWAARD
jgi:hypothetical protein